MTEPRAWAKSDLELKKEIHAALRQHPPGEGAWWQGLGPGVPAAVLALYRETTQARSQVKLVEVLGNYDDAEATRFLKDLVKSTRNGAVRQAAIHSLARSQKMREETFFAEQLQSTDPQTRLATAEALKGMRDARASQMVEDYVKRESVAWIVTRLTAPAPAKPKIRRASRINP